MQADYLRSFAQAKSAYEKRATRQREIICRAGPHMNCAVLKMQKAAWTNDDLRKMGNQSGIFFSIWAGDNAARKGRADYNIHAMSVRELKRYRLTGNQFCDDFRDAFAKTRASWPNVETDFGCQTLMQGWFDIDPKRFASDVLQLMNRFDDKVAPIIDKLLEQRIKPVRALT
jgi:hypothetical protein